MKNLIYRPAGRALEYGALACNPYAGCVHGCEYCYIRSLGMDPLNPKERSLAGLEEEARKDDQEVFFSFACDPLLGPHGIAAINLVAKYRPVRILSKRGPVPGVPYGPSISHGTTVTTLDGGKEPNAPAVALRMTRIALAKERGSRTFLSLEPLCSWDAVEAVELYGSLFDEINVGGATRMARPDAELIRAVVAAAKKCGASVGMKRDAFDILKGDDLGCVRLWETEGRHGS